MRKPTKIDKVHPVTIKISAIAISRKTSFTISTFSLLDNKNSAKKHLNISKKTILPIASSIFLKTIVVKIVRAKLHNIVKTLTPSITLSIRKAFK